MTVESFNIGGKPAEGVYLGDIKLWPAEAGADPATTLLQFDESIPWMVLDWANASIINGAGPIAPAPPMSGGAWAPFPAAANIRVTNKTATGCSVEWDSFTFDYHWQCLDPYNLQMWSVGVIAPIPDRPLGYLKVPVSLSPHVPQTTDDRGGMSRGRAVGVSGLFPSPTYPTAFAAVLHPTQADAAVTLVNLNANADSLMPISMLPIAAGKPNKWTWVVDTLKSGQAYLLIQLPGRSGALIPYQLEGFSAAGMITGRHTAGPVPPSPPAGPVVNDSGPCTITLDPGRVDFSDLNLWSLKPVAGGAP
jgi:hypothetical protein